MPLHLVRRPKKSLALLSGELQQGVNRNKQRNKQWFFFRHEIYHSFHYFIWLHFLVVLPPNLLGFFSDTTVSSGPNVAMETVINLQVWWMYYISLKVALDLICVIWYSQTRWLLNSVHDSLQGDIIQRTFKDHGQY